MKMKMNQLYKKKGINHCFPPSLSMKEMLILFGLSIGRPKALDQIPLERHPKALETAKTQV